MTSVAKHLAHGPQMSLEKQIVRLRGAGDRWLAETNSL